MVIDLSHVLIGEDGPFHPFTRTTPGGIRIDENGFILFFGQFQGFLEASLEKTDTGFLAGKLDDRKKQRNKDQILKTYLVHLVKVLHKKTNSPPYPDKKWDFISSERHLQDAYYSSGGS
jgi:hypothetical protein